MSVLTLTLMNHTFELPCEPHQRDGLIDAATLIEEKLDQVPGLKGESKILMVAINLAFDYLQLKDETTQYTMRLEDQIESAINQIARDCINNKDSSTH